MSKRDRYDSDDNRYFYEHYEGKDYYEGYSGFNRGKIDLIIYIIFTEGAEGLPFVVLARNKLV